MSVFRQITLLSLCALLAACGSEESNAAQSDASAPQTAETVVNDASEPSTSENVLSEGSKVVDLSTEERRALEKRFLSRRIIISDVQISPVDGMYELTTNAGVLYSTKAGDFFFSGTLYSLGENGELVDLLAMKQQPITAEKVSQFRDSMIEYKAADEKYAVTIFTDITCGYCVKLHQELEDYNNLGITVRYLAYPRQGLNTATAESMAKIWCAADPEAALHDAKISRKIADPVGDMNVCRQDVAAQFNLGRDIGMSGTPAIILPSGKLVGGYVPAHKLLAILEEG